MEKSDDGWRLLVNEKLFIVKGMVYSPCTVGNSPNSNTMRDWMVVDDDQDGRNDLAYQSWIDSNRNNKKDDNETEVGDFQLMKDMGVNTIRIYHHPSDHPDAVAPTLGAGDSE